MTQVSKFKLNRKVYEKIFTLFPQFLYRMISKGKQGILVESFFTSTEKIVFAKRISIAFMLVKGYTYDQIVEKIKVSHGTVAKIADILKEHGDDIVKELESISKEEAFADFLNTIGYKLDVILPPKGGNWSTWRSRIEKEHNDAKGVF